jgi:hypothetical protein
MIGRRLLHSNQDEPRSATIRDGTALPVVTRYLFHFHDGVDQPDLTGTELANSKAARDAAVVFMGEKLKELGGDFWPEGEWSMRVVDETGATVCASGSLAIRFTAQRA